MQRAERKGTQGQFWVTAYLGGQCKNLQLVTTKFFVNRWFLPSTSQTKKTSIK